MGIVDGVRVLYVEVVAARGDVRDGNAPGEFVFLAPAFLARFAPPLFLGVEFLDLSRDSCRYVEEFVESALVADSA